MIKKRVLAILLLAIVQTPIALIGQEIAPKKASKKGDFYFYWGYNRGFYGNSNIHFKGTDYQFDLDKVTASDRQSPFNFDTYFNIQKLTIPQYNIRVGYFLNDKYSISLGVDHMKYVVDIDQTVKIRGKIANSGTYYDGTYNNENIVLADEFLTFEHTDGLNYVNSELRRYDQLFKYKKVDLQFLEGLGAGLLIPRTNVQLLNNQRHDEFNLAGYGLNAVLGLKLNFFKHFFIQAELKEGFINMPNVKNTYNNAD